QPTPSIYTLSLHDALPICYTLRHERPSFHAEFDWTGSDDPSPWLCVPTAIDVVGSMLPGGWPEVRARCRELALAGRRRLAAALRSEEHTSELQSRENLVCR